MSRSRLIAMLMASFVAGGTLVGMLTRNPPEPLPLTTQTQNDTAAEPEVLYWYDPMVPQHKFDKPGPSPFMDMQLVPKYADAGNRDDDGVRVDARLLQNLGVRTAKARLGTLEHSLRASGTIEFDERAVTTVSAPVDAIVLRMHVRAPWEEVAAGAALVTLLAPTWTAAQQEYLSLLQAEAPALQNLLAAARQRLVLLGMSPAQILALERDRQINPHIVLRAPRAGVVAELPVREGATVMAGNLLARINGRDRVWINAAIPERDAALIGAGAAVRATLRALPGRTFSGRVEQMLASVDAQTRTQTARIVIDNSGRSLIPGMYAELQLHSTADAEQHVLVPTEAVIETGTRQVVVVAAADGGFRSQAVTLGREADGSREILSGLDADDTVVLSGQFLIDSEASLNALESRMKPPAGTSEPVPSERDQEAPQ
jgi:membrane fusion protein, copper/silver efflux system